MDYPPPRPPGMGMPPGGPGYGMHPPYGMIPPPGMPPMMPPRPPYAAQADARLRMSGMRGDMPPPMSALGPPVTVFVGNITEKAQDSMIRQLLNTSGHVNSWKRVQGATGKLQAFGFCEYANPDAALRAIRLLHDWEVADKKLVVKVDAKTKDVLEDFKKKKRKALLGEEKEKDADKDHVKESEYVDPAMRKEDETTKERIKTIIKDHSKDMNAYISSSGEKRSRRPHGHGGLVNNDGEVRLTGPKESLEDVELEAGKRDIINREIGKFRETMKIREKEKEEEKKKREKESGSGGEESSSRKSKDRDRSDRGGGDRESQDRRRESKRRPTRSPSPGADRSNSKSNRENRSRSDRGSRAAVSRSRSRSREERRSRSRRDSPVARERRDPKDVRRERELEEESKDRNRAERKANEKERSYQERLKKWETREGKMARQYENDKQKEFRKKEDEDREALKLREFLEDYDDDKNDEKYYKGSRLDRRMTEREREAAKDAEDRAHEKEEIEELRVKILNEGHADPNAELERRMAELEGRKLVEFVDLEAENNDVIGVSPPRNDDEEPMIMDDHIVPEVIPMDEDSISPQAAIQMGDSDQDKTPTTTPKSSLVGSGSLGNNLNTINLGGSANSNNSKPAASFIQIQPKKKIDVKDVFNQDDDDTGPAKKKKLPPLSLAASNTNSSAASANSAANAAAAAAAASADTKKKSSDEDKRKHIKSLIEKIPTDKAALFEYRIDWDFVDNQLMEKRIRPWVNKKIAEYIGEPEPTLTDFICSKVLAGSTPKSVLDDVQMVLDEEAEVFVVKMWRLLIYEIENKKLKAVASSNQQQQTSSNA